MLRYEASSQPPLKIDCACISCNMHQAFCLARDNKQVVPNSFNLNDLKNATFIHKAYFLDGYVNFYAETVIVCPYLLLGIYQQFKEVH